MKVCTECGREFETDQEGQLIESGCEYAECPMDVGFLLDEDDYLPLHFDDSAYTNETEPDLVDLEDEE